MAIKTIRRIVNLDSCPQTDILPGALFTGEKSAHVFVIFCRQGAQALALSGGEVRGEFINELGQTVELTGSVVAGAAMLPLSDDCYAVRGRFGLTIFHDADGASCALYHAEGKITLSETDTAIVPGTVVPSVSALIQEIEDAMASWDGQDYSAVSAQVACLNRDGALADAFRTRPLYDHLFVNTLSASVAIPHQSLFNVRRSRQLGFRIIEANMQKTSDGVFVVNHFTGGKFGAFFTHVDGTTDISDVAVSSVTWDWIAANVRYKSTIAKYRVHPPRLEEFLAECRQQGMIPFAQISYAEAAEIVESYMGKEGYIAYGATREICPTAMIYKWAALTTKADILAACQALGAPMIYGMANPQAFTDSELRDIVDTLHRNGFRIATSYKDEHWHKYAALGFDLNGAQWQINRIEQGNLCNFDSIFGFGHFAVTGATEADGKLTFTAAGTITPQVDDAVRDLCAVDIEVDFTGTITVPAFGELLAANHAGVTYTSDGTRPVFVAVPIVNGSPKITLSVASGTVIRDIRFKASDYSDMADLNQDVAELKSAVEELAENGYYTEDAADIYLTLTTGGITSSGSVAADFSKGYIWLTPSQEQLTLKLDTSVYSYNLCYMNGETVAKFTSWQTASPIVFDSTAHTQIGITVKKTAGGNINTILDQILYYSTGGSIGNLATKDYTVAKQQSVSDSGKVLGIGNDGVVSPIVLPAGVEVDDTLSVAGDAADAKATGDIVTEVVLNGYIAKGMQNIFFALTYGQISATNGFVASANTGYIYISKQDIPAALNFDSSVYKVNYGYVKNNTMMTGTYTGWIETSPIQPTPPDDCDSMVVNVRKLSGNYGTGELNTALYKVEMEIVGNLATKTFVNDLLNNYSVKGRRMIYPDAFESRIMPDIFYNGRFYADFDTIDYKINGASEVWVATDGNDSTGDGSEDNPYLTITKALTQSAVTINLKEGTYEQGTHYNANVNFGGHNYIGHGNVTLQNDASGHSTMVSTSAYFENIVFKHGHATLNPAFSASCSGSGQHVCFVGCTFRDGGDNGLSVTGMDAVLVGCVSYGNRLDGFNYHDKTVSSVVYIPNVLEIDCVAYNNGSSESGSDSCNGSTAHDGTKIIRLNGEYYSCYGGVIAEIARTGEEPTISVNYGVLAHDSTGTSNYKASFWASVNTQMYLYDCLCYGGDYDITAINDAKVVSWRLTTGRDEPAVSKATTATVIQH